jgi:hypothetical protein
MDDLFDKKPTTSSKPKDNVFFLEHEAKPVVKKNLFSISDSESEEDEEYTTRKIKIGKTVKKEEKSTIVEEKSEKEDYEKEEYRLAMEKVKRDVAERRKQEEDEKQRKEDEKKKKLDLERQRIEKDKLDREREEKEKQVEKDRIDARLEQEKLEKKKDLFQVKSVFVPDFEDLNDILGEVPKKKAPPLPSRNKTVTTKPPTSTGSVPSSSKRVDVSSTDFNLDKYINNSSTQKKGLFDL